MAELFFRWFERRVARLVGLHYGCAMRKTQYVRRGWIEGAARVIDLGGQLDLPRKIQSPDADVVALRRDFERVAGDFSRATAQVVKPQRDQ